MRSDRSADFSALAWVRVIAFSQSSSLGLLNIVHLLQLVDFPDQDICFGAAVAAVGATPLRFRCRGDPFRRAGPPARAFVDGGNPIDSARRVRQVGDAGCLAIAPARHQFVMGVGPEFRRPLDGPFPRHPKDASRPATPAAALVGVERDEVEVRVPEIVPVLVVDSEDIPRLAFGQSLGEGPRERPALLGVGFDRQRYDEAFGHAPLLADRLGLRRLRRFRVDRRYTRPLHDAGRTRSRDVAQMSKGLPLLGSAFRAIHLGGEALDGMSE